MNVLVTGCRSGIGLQTALAFGRRGDRVYAAVRDPARCDELRAAVDGESLPVTVVRLDVTDGDAIDATVADMLAGEGRIDVVVNNAGVGFVSAVEEMDLALATQTWATNFWGPFRMMRAVLPSMRAAGRGVIVNVSTYGVNFPGGGGLAMYVACKRALTQLTEVTQDEVTGSGVRLVSIEPGFFATQVYGDDKRQPIDERSFYAPLLHRVDDHIAANVRDGADPAIVAAGIVAAADDASTPPGCSSATTRWRPSVATGGSSPPTGGPRGSRAVRRRGWRPRHARRR